MKTPLEMLKSVFGRSYLVSAQAHLSARDFAKSALTNWRRRIVRLDPELSIKLRAIAKLAGKEDYLLKLTYIHENEEVPDLELVLYTAYDPDMGVWFARRVRAVSKEHEYRNTARDEQLMLGFDPVSASDDLAAKLVDHADSVNVIARKLYKQALVHVGDRHPELDRAIEEPRPFDYAQEMLRALKNHGELDIQDKAKASAKSVSSLKENEDTVLKFDLVSEGLKEGTELYFYLTIDSLFDTVMIRKIRVRNKQANDYSDSDNDHQVTLDKDPKEASRELIEQIEHGAVSDVVFDMVMRAETQMSSEEDF